MSAKQTRVSDCADAIEAYGRNDTLRTLREGAPLIDFADHVKVHGAVLNPLSMIFVASSRIVFEDVFGRFTEDVWGQYPQDEDDDV